MTLPLSPLRSIFSAITVIGILALSPGQAHSQPGIRLGPLLGYHLTLHTSGPLYTAGIDETLHYPANTNGGEMAGLSLQYLFDTTWSIGLELAYNNLSGKKKNRIFLLSSPEGELYEIEYVFDTETDPDTLLPAGVFAPLNTIVYTTLSFGLCGQWRTSLDSSLRVGWQLGFFPHLVLARNSIEELRIESPDNARFFNAHGLPIENNGKERILYDGTIPESSSYRFSVKGALFAEIGDRESDVILMPGLYYEYGLTPVEPSSNWRIHSMGVQVALMFNL